MNIKSVLQEVRTFAELETIVKKAQANLSFWGFRYITVLDYEGTSPIDALAAKVLELVRKNPDFNEVERKHGKTIMRPIDNIYRVSDKLVKKANCLTKFFAKLNSIPNLILSGFRRDVSKLRWHWRDCDIVWLKTSCSGDYKGFYKIFHFYTETQYKDVFKKIPRNASKQLHGLVNFYWEHPEIRNRYEWFDDV